MLSFRFSREINGMEYQISDLEDGSIITPWTPIQDKDCAKQAEYFAQRMVSCFRRNK